MVNTARWSYCIPVQLHVPQTPSSTTSSSSQVTSSTVSRESASADRVVALFFLLLLSSILNFFKFSVRLYFLYTRKKGAYQFDRKRTLTLVCNMDCSLPQGERVCLHTVCNFSLDLFKDSLVQHVLCLLHSECQLDVLFARLELAVY